MTLLLWMRSGAHRGRTTRWRQQQHHARSLLCSSSIFRSMSTSSSSSSSDNKKDDKQTVLSASSLKPWQTIDPSLRGLSQVLFVNSPHAGLAILGGIALENPFVSILAMTGAVTATTVTHWGQEKGWITTNTSPNNDNKQDTHHNKKSDNNNNNQTSLSWSNGHYSYNGCLVGCATGVYITPLGFEVDSLFSLYDSIDFIQAFLTNSAVLQTALCGTFLTMVGASITPFLVDQLDQKYSTLLLLTKEENDKKKKNEIISKSTTQSPMNTNTNYSVDSNNPQQQPLQDTMQQQQQQQTRLPQFLWAYNLVSIPMITMHQLLFLDPSVVTTATASLDAPEYIYGLDFNTSLQGVSQIFGIDGVTTGFLTLFGVAYYSPLLATHCFVGSLVGAMTGGALCFADGMLGANVVDIAQGYWSYNGALVGLGVGYYFTHAPQTMLLTMGSSVSATLLYGIMHHTTTTTMLTLPFCITMTGCYIIAPRYFPKLHLAKKPHSPERNLRY